MELERSEITRLLEQLQDTLSVVMWVTKAPGLDKEEEYHLFPCWELDEKIVSVISSQVQAPAAC